MISWRCPLPSCRIFFKEKYIFSWKYEKRREEAYAVVRHDDEKFSFSFQELRTWQILGHSRRKFMYTYPLHMYTHTRAKTWLLDKKRKLKSSLSLSHYNKTCTLDESYKYAQKKLFCYQTRRRRRWRGRKNLLTFTRHTCSNKILKKEKILVVFMLKKKINFCCRKIRRFNLIIMNADL